MREIKQVGSLVAVFSLILAAGCATSTTTSSTSTPPGPAGAHTIYVVQNAVQNGGVSDSVLEFSATANGDVSPAASITGPAGVQFTSVAVDISGNLYVGSDFPTPEILIYAAEATGPWAPVRTIAGSLTQLAVPTSVALDPSGQIYVTNYGTSLSVLVFAANATGNVAPIRTIAPTATWAPSSIAVDTSNVFVTDLISGDVLVFPSSANGTVTPAQTIGGTTTDLVQSYGVAVDTAGDIYATNDTRPWAIMEFAPTANGNVAPTRAIEGSVNIAGVAVDNAGTIYTVDASPSNGALAIEVFSSSASNAAVPSAIIGSSAWTGCTMGQIAIH